MEKWVGFFWPKVNLHWQQVWQGGQAFPVKSSGRNFHAWNELNLQLQSFASNIFEVYTRYKRGGNFIFCKYLKYLRWKFWNGAEECIAFRNSFRMSWRYKTALTLEVGPAEAALKARKSILGPSPPCLWAVNWGPQKGKTVRPPHLSGCVLLNVHEFSRI